MVERMINKMRELREKQDRYHRVSNYLNYFYGVATISSFSAVILILLSDWGIIPDTFSDLVQSTAYALIIVVIISCIFIIILSILDTRNVNKWASDVHEFGREVDLFIEHNPEFSESQR